MANCQSSSPIAHRTCFNLGTESRSRSPVYLSVPVGQASAVPVLKRASTVSTNSDKAIDLSTRNTQPVCLKVGCFLQKKENKDLCTNHYYKAAHNAAQAKYAKTPAAKAVHKAAQAKYDKTSAAKAAHKAAKAKYDKTPAAKAAKAKYAKTPAAKAAKAIENAQRYAYNKELAQSGSETLANQKGDAAANIKRKKLEAQKNQNAYQIAPPPLLKRQTEEIFTIPIEPISS
ncbi:hypothetical protein [Endozoicomonas sp.]|uniref:hypothetical protein n=1 Tax=Endozoicomonas sp. TaxID=1892382 RepID=UPI00383B4831